MKLGALLLAGLLAGLWINLSGIALVHFVLGQEYVEGLMAHLPGPPGPATLVRHLALRFGFGLLGVGLYALLRPRLATGPAAVLATGAFLFLASYVPLAALLNELRVLVGWRLWASLAWGAAEALVAVLAGSRLYERLGG